MDTLCKLFLNSPMVVTNQSNTIYENSGFPNPPVGGVFNNYNINTEKVLYGIDSPATCWALIDLCNMYKISHSQDILNKIDLIANYISTHLIDCNFYGSPFKAFPNSYAYDTTLQEWAASTRFIHSRTFYHAIWALLEAYDITHNSNYLTASRELLDGAAIFSENIKARINRKEIANYMYGALYNTIGSLDGSSFTPDWSTFSNTTADVIYRSITKYIELLGNETRTNGEGISYTVQNVRDDYINFLVNAYDNHGLRKPDGHNLLFGFYHYNDSDTKNADGSYNPIAMNWDWNNDIWGQDQWFTGDLEFWSILGLALAGQKDIAKSLLDRYYQLKAPDTQGRLLFYDRYDKNGTHLIDDTSKSICFTGLYMQARNIIGDHSYDSACMSALSFYQINSNNIVMDGGYQWDVTIPDAFVENKSLGEIVFSIMQNKLEMN